MKLVKLDPRYEGKCRECGEEDLRITYVKHHTSEGDGLPMIWCPDCMTSRMAFNPGHTIEMAWTGPFFDQRIAIMAIRKQELAQLREEHAAYKAALQSIFGQCVYMLNAGVEDDGLGVLDTYQTVCDGLGLDADYELEQSKEEGESDDN
jgi:hypothetical protein